MKYSRQTRWALGAALAAGVLCPLAVLTPASAAVQSQSARGYTGNITVDGVVASRSPFLRYGNTNFMGIWYFEQLLKQRGIHTTWNGYALQVANLPRVQSVSLQVNGSNTTSQILSVGGVHFVDATALLRQLGGQARYQSDSHTVSLAVPSTGSVAQIQPSSPPTLSPSPHYHAVQVTESVGRIASLSSTPILQNNGTSFAGVWYLERWLQDMGYTSKWVDAQELQIPDLPTWVETGHVAAGSQADATPLIEYKGDWYVPAHHFAAVTGWTVNLQNTGVVVTTGAQPIGTPGLSGSPVIPQTTWVLASSSAGSRGSSLQVHGAVTGGGAASEIALLLPDGTVQTAQVQSDGQFSTSIGASSAVVIGVRTGAAGWVGETLAVHPGNAANLQLSDTPVTSHISGTVKVAAGESVANQMMVLRSDLNHEHFDVPLNAGTFQADVPAGPYEVWTVGVNGRSVFLGQRFLAQAGDTTLNLSMPALPTGSTEAAGVHAQVVATTGVTPEQLQSAANIVKRVLPYDESTTGLEPAGTIEVDLYATTAAYIKHFEQEGYSVATATNFGTQSQAMTEGSQSLSINLQGLNSEFEVDVLAHELTHALIGTVSVSLPSWLNEGLAWHQGVGAEVDGSPSTLLSASRQWQVWEDIVNHQKIGDLFALGAASSLSPAYNVEAQDYFAVEQLIRQFGLAAVYQFVERIDSMGESSAFSTTFAESEATWKGQVTSLLENDAAQNPTTLTVSVRVQPGGPSQLFVSDPAGKTYWFAGAQVGQAYTFVCQTDGTVTTPAGLTLSGTDSAAGDGTWYLGANSGADQGLFEVNPAFHLNYLEAQAMFYGSSNTPVEQTATALPIGLQLISIDPAPVTP